MYLAHIRESGEKQTVREHCRSTADLAAKALKPIGLEHSAYLAGLLHDMGKCKEEFAQYLEAAAEGGEAVRGSVNHTFAGVRFLLRQWHGPGEELGYAEVAAELLAFAVGSHHGLFDCIDARQSCGFDHRLTKPGIAYEEALRNYLAECADPEELESLFQASMVSGKLAPPASQHPKKIINICANAKLVSANDTSGFTYRGRFKSDAEAMTMSYEASQKSHNALHWLAATQGVAIGGRTFLCWNPQGVGLPRVQATFLRKGTPKQVKYSDYRKALSETLRGWKETIPADAGAVIAAFDAATSGRLALTYYSELPASDFLERLHNWDALCCWNHDPFGIQAPSLFQIANCAFGTVRTSGSQTKLETDDRILRQQVQRLLSCRVDKGKMPADIARAAAAKASNLQIMDTQLRETVLSTACAVLRKYYYDWDREEWNMSLEPEKKDISYQYGRLLAVFEKIERDTYDKDEQREPNAIRMQSVFAKRPRYASRILWEQLKKAYYPHLKPWNRVKYDRLIGEIIEQISDLPQAEHEEALKDTYLFGYYLQKKALYTSDKTENSQEEE